MNRRSLAVAARLALALVICAGPRPAAASVQHPPEPKAAAPAAKPAAETKPAVPVKPAGDAKPAGASHAPTGASGASGPAAAASAASAAHKADDVKASGGAKPSATAAAPTAKPELAPPETVADRIMRRMSESVSPASLSASAAANRTTVAASSRTRAPRVTLSWRTGLVWPTALTDDVAAGAVPAPATRITLIWK